MGAKSTLLKVDFEFSTTLFAHEILNPPSLNVGSDVTLMLVDSKELDLIKKVIKDKFRRPPRTSYVLRIFNRLLLVLLAARGQLSRKKSKTSYWQ
jgi:hypothetical protein